MDTNQVTGELHAVAAICELLAEARPDDSDLLHAMRLAQERLAAAADALEAID